MERTDSVKTRARAAASRGLNKRTLITDGKIPAILILGYCQISRRRQLPIADCEICATDAAGAATGTTFGCAAMPASMGSQVRSIEHGNCFGCTRQNGSAAPRKI